MPLLRSPRRFHGHGAVVRAVPAAEGRQAGFLAGVAWRLSLERAAQLGNLVAVQALETTGTQEYKLVPAELASRCAASYGQAAADDIIAHITPVNDAP